MCAPLVSSCGSIVGVVACLSVLRVCVGVQLSGVLVLEIRLDEGVVAVKVEIVHLLVIAVCLGISCLLCRWGELLLA